MRACCITQLHGCASGSLRWLELPALTTPAPAACTPRRPRGAFGRSASSATGPFGALPRGAVSQPARAGNIYVVPT